MDLFSLSYMEIDFVLFNGYALSLEYVIVYNYSQMDRYLLLPPVTRIGCN